MRRKRISFAIGLAVMCVAVVHAQAPTTNREQQPPDLTLQVWDTTAADFSARIARYIELRSELEKELPALTVIDDPAETRAAMRALAQRIQRERAGAAPGEIFRPATSIEFKKALLHETDASTCAAILDEDNPGELGSQINATYPEGKPLSSMPVTILAVLPALPEDLEYRFMGRDLILLDTRANVILDRVPEAIQCAECGRLPCHR